MMNKTVTLHDGKSIEIREHRSLNCLSACGLLCVWIQCMAALQAAVVAHQDHSSPQPSDASGDWPEYGLTSAEDRFSPLDRIHADNASELGLAWAKKLGTTRGLEATPIVVNGLMFISLPWSAVMAVDAHDGKTLWKWDPQVDKAIWAQKACCDVVNRGVAYRDGRVFASTLDGRLVGLDAITGELLWEQWTIDREGEYTVTGAPRIFDGKVVIGNGGAEYGVRGYITAYDCESGEQAWRTYTVPGDPSKGFESKDMEIAAKTWSGDWWTVGGGGTCWDGFAYDPELKLLYVGTGNASPWTRTERNRETKGRPWLDNLYLSCILALHADTGRVAWYYQTTPGDNWDYTAVQQMILTDLKLGGQDRKVIMQAPKNGFFYVLDRATGELLSAEPYTEVNWAERIDLETGRPVETEVSDYSSGPRDIKPGPHGGHNWQSMSYHPKQGLVYIPTIEARMIYRQDKSWNYRKGDWNVAVDFDNPAPVNTEKDQGGLVAWDPVKQQAAWRISHPNRYNGGTMATAGDLVFQGNGEAELVAYHAKSGEVLWSFFTGTAIIAPPVTYMIGGEQYVSVLAGWGGSYGLANPPSGEAAEYFQEGILYTFKLGGKASSPTLMRQFRTAQDLSDAVLTLDSSKVEAGNALYIQHCRRCHGGIDGQSGAIPDLATTVPAYHKLWHPIVSEGMLAAAKGMPGFKGRLTLEEIDSIQHFVVDATRRLAQENDVP
jgi:quinohemoprotein ethanol dehydrogenase